MLPIDCATEGVKCISAGEVRNRYNAFTTGRSPCHASTQSLPKFAGMKLMRAEKQQKVKNGYDALTPDIG
jgi:hypothetical protein